MAQQSSTRRRRAAAGSGRPAVYRAGPQRAACALLAAALAWPAAAHAATQAGAAPTAAPASTPLPALPATPAGGRCADEQELPVNALPAPGDAAVAEARQEVLQLLRQAELRSQALGAARLLAEAAAADLDEAHAAPLPNVTLNGSSSATGQRSDGVQQSGRQHRADLTLSAPLFDGGYRDELVNWRQRLLEAARQNELDAREQVALQTLSQALERQRYRLQAEVYERYTASMGCLVGALEQIVAADRGRASELLQARNTHRQAELALAQARSQQRQAEIRLRRYIGDDTPLPQAPLQALLAGPPPLQQTLDAAARASAIAQLGAQAEAQQHLTRALRAQRGPQWSWSVSGTRLAGGSSGAYSAWSGGIGVTVPLLDATAKPAIAASALRGEATLAQRDEALSQRLARVSETQEQAESALDRARRATEVLQVSQRLRQATRLQWQQLGRRSLFDVISTEGDFHNLQVTRINALLDAQQASALLWSLGNGVATGLAGAVPAAPR